MSALEIVSLPRRRAQPGRSSCGTSHRSIYLVAVSAAATGSARAPGIPTIWRWIPDQGGGRPPRGAQGCIRGPIDRNARRLGSSEKLDHLRPGIANGAGLSPAGRRRTAERELCRPVAARRLLRKSGEHFKGFVEIRVSTRPGLSEERMEAGSHPDGSQALPSSLAGGGHTAGGCGRSVQRGSGRDARARAGRARGGDSGDLPEGAGREARESEEEARDPPEQDQRRTGKTGAAAAHPQPRSHRRMAGGWSISRASRGSLHRQAGLRCLDGGEPWGGAMDEASAQAPEAPEEVVHPGQRPRFIEAAG